MDRYFIDPSRGKSTIQRVSTQDKHGNYKTRLCDYRAEGGRE